MEARIEELCAENRLLREEIALLKQGRKSDTSHTPPSLDLSRSNTKNLREKSEKPSGGQKGHEGHTLLMVDNPNNIIVHKPTKCVRCGINLSDLSSEMVGRRQVVDIPPIQAEYTEHQIHSITCSCSQVNQAMYPEGVDSIVQYGSNIEAMVGYLNVYQYVPYKRLTILLHDLFSVPISEGSVSLMMNRLYEKALPHYETIREKISQSHVVGGDETGTKIAGKKGWMHVWQNSNLTYIVASMSRGYQVMAEEFKEGFPNSVYVSDCWAAQLKVKSKEKQICIVHLLRELKNFEESLNCKWSTKLKELFKKAIALKRESKTNGITPFKIEQIKTELDDILSIDGSHLHKKVQPFAKRLRKYSDHIMTFLSHPQVPPDNNGSERAIRNIKVKTKISTGFRTYRGSEIFATLRSVVDTSLKNNGNVFASFYNLARI